MQLLGRTCGREAPLLRKWCLEIGSRLCRLQLLKSDRIDQTFLLLSFQIYVHCDVVVCVKNKPASGICRGQCVDHAGRIPSRYSGTKGQRRGESLTCFLYLFLKEKIDWKHHSVKWPFVCLFRAKKRWLKSMGYILRTDPSNATVGPLNEWINKVS